MPAADQVAICNIALGRIAQKPIADIEEETRPGRACKSLWDSALRDTLRGNAWPFATVIQPLALVANYTPFMYQYAYIYPSTCVAFWKVYSNQAVGAYADVVNNGGLSELYGPLTKQYPQGEAFRLLLDPVNNQKVIVTNCSQAYGEYTIEVTDTTLFDANFVSAMGYRLAADLALPLVGSQSLGESMAKAFTSAISDAQRTSSYETNEQPTQKSSYHKSRG